MQVYVTKYALTQDIQLREVEPGLSSSDGYVFDPEAYHQVFKLGRDAFHTWEDARNAALDMQTRKIASLEKQINRLRNLKFEQE